MHILLRGSCVFVIFCARRRVPYPTFSTTDNNNTSFIISAMRCHARKEKNQNETARSTVDRYHCDENMCIVAITRREKRKNLKEKI